MDGKVGISTWNYLFRSTADVTQFLKNLMIKYEYMYAPEWGKLTGNALDGDDPYD